MSISSPEDHSQPRKKRVGKACDLCRIKKSKCDGRKPCSRCMADNKLCAFTEKKRPKDKTHPSMYIELLETRIDLLTRSLLKVVTMAAPHLQFLQDLIEKAKLEHLNVMPLTPEEDPLLPGASFPINEVVSYLISELNQSDDEHGVARPVRHADALNATSEGACAAEGSQLWLTTAEKQQLLVSSPEVETINRSKAGGDPHDGISLMSQRLQNAQLTHALADTPAHPAANISRSTGGSPANPAAAAARDARSYLPDYGSPARSILSSTQLVRSSSIDSFAGLPAKTSLSRLNRDVPNDPSTNFVGCLLPPSGDIHHGNRRRLIPLIKVCTSRLGRLAPSLLCVSNWSTDNTLSTSPLSVSAISIKLESQSFDDAARYNIRRLHSTQTHVMSSLSRKRNSGHVHKPLLASTHSPHTFLLNLLVKQRSPELVSVPIAEMQMQMQTQMPGQELAQTTQMTQMTQVPSQMPKLSLGDVYGPLGAQNDSFFDEPPLKVLTEAGPLFLDGDELGMTNPFLCSLGYS